MSDVIGLVGAGNSARALARGWGEPVLCTDAGSGRAAALAAEVGGEAVADNAELAARADWIVLCHKPHQMEAVADQIGGRARAVVSALAGVPLRRLAEVYPSTPVLRVNFNLPVEVRQGVLCVPPVQPAPEELVAAVTERFALLGSLFRLEERMWPTVSMLSGVGPAYLALLMEAQVDAAVRFGLDRVSATAMAVRTMAGTAALVGRFGGDPAALRHAVTSPGGVTASGLAALEKAGLRAALLAAGESVADWLRAGRPASRTEPS